MDLTKHKRVRLKGKAVAKLNEMIHERDNYTCIIPGCGRYVSLGEKWHHESCGKDKEDRIEKGCLLCSECHHERHNGKRSSEIRRQCEKYLSGLYPDAWEGVVYLEGIR